MTQAPTLNGVVIGQTARATKALLDLLLAETNTPFVSWVTLNLLATHGDMAIDSLVDQLVTGLGIDEVEASTSINDLVCAALIAGDAALGLTTDGEATHQRIRSGIDDITHRLYGDLPHEDLVTARRVLETVTDRARAELAGR